MLGKVVNLATGLAFLIIKYNANSCKIRASTLPYRASPMYNLLARRKHVLSGKSVLKKNSVTEDIQQAIAIAQILAIIVYLFRICTNNVRNKV